MHSVKYGLVKVCARTSHNQLVKVSNTPVGFSRLAIKLHQQDLIKRSNNDNKLNVFEKVIQELPINLQNEQYSIHVENINVNRNVYKDLDIYEIYKMEKMYSEKTGNNIVVYEKPIESGTKTAFGAAIGSIVGISLIFGFYGVFSR